jgi:hypothetical protein
MLGNSSAMRVRDDVQARRRPACLSAEEFHEHALANRRPFPNQTSIGQNRREILQKNCSFSQDHPRGFLKKAASRPKMG